MIICYPGKGSNIRKRALWFLHLFITAASGAVVDTVITADGSPGPFPLGRLFIDSSSITVSRPDSGFLPSWTYLPTVNGLLFADPIEYGVPLRVRFETDYYGLPKMYSFYEKRYRTPEDTSGEKSDDSLYRSKPPPQRELLTVSGYKTVGVSMGSFGQLNLEQGLDVRIGGEIRPGTEVSAHLNDQGSSLDGTTREISEFDMIYIALNDPRFSVVVGDHYVRWPFQGILEGRKKIKGISASVSPKNFTVNGFGALAGGVFTVQTIRGDGGQGPYSFTGNGEAGFITPIGGTIRVMVNGATLEEGEDKDYVVDYDLGTMTFTPRLLIKPEDLIRVEYEYKMFEYQRTLSGMTAGASTPDSAFSVQGVFWSEIDNKNSPIELALTESGKRALSSSGDRPPLDTAAEEVNPNDVLDRYASIPLYEKRDSLGITLFVHREPDRQRPQNNDSLHDVHFSEAVDGCGDYVRETSKVYPDYIYRYAGPCGGAYTPLTPLTAPQRLLSGEMKADLTLPLIRATVDVAGQERDRNLFSSIDDDDNLSSAANISALVGKRRYDAPSLWAGGSGRFFSRRFDREALSAFDRKSSWNDNSITENSAERMVWESMAGATPFSGLSTEFTYGQQREDGRILTDKAANSSRYSPLSWLRLDYSGAYFRHFEESGGHGTGHRQNALAGIRLRRHSASLGYSDEWRAGASGAGDGLVRGEMAYEFLPLRLSESFSMTRFRKGNRSLFSASDTGTELLWKQSVGCAPVPWWKVNGVSTWQSRDIRDPEGRRRSSTLLIDLGSEIGGSGDPYSSRQRYVTTAEKASRFIQIPTYVGEGKGTHRWDTTRNEYVEDLHGAGEYIIAQRDVFDSTNSLRTRKTTFTVDWELRPEEKKLRGILDDLSWEGTLHMEEHLDALISRPSSWFPGYLSLRNLKKRVVRPEKIRYCDLSYRQEIGWDPSFNPKLRGRLSAAPDYRKIRSYHERGLTTTLFCGYGGKHLSYDCEFRLFGLFHDDTLDAVSSADYRLRDMSVTSTQTKPLGGILELHLKECFGIARQDAAGEERLKRPLDSTAYVQITPGATLFIGERGRVGADYTFSMVRVPGDHDYRVASGFLSGISHLIVVNANVTLGKYFSLSGSYRGEIFRKGEGMAQEPNRHSMSLEVQALL